MGASIYLIIINISKEYGSHNAPLQGADEKELY